METLVHHSFCLFVCLPLKRKTKAAGSFLDCTVVLYLDVISLHADNMLH